MYKMLQINLETLQFVKRGFQQSLALNRVIRVEKEENIASVCI